MMRSAGEGAVRWLLVAMVLSAGLALASPAVGLADDGDLWLYGTAATGDTQLQVLGGTGPAIAGLTTGGFETAWQGADGVLTTAGSNGSGRLGLSMAAGTDPAIAGMSGGAWEIAFLPATP